MYPPRLRSFPSGRAPVTVVTLKRGMQITESFVE